MNILEKIISYKRKEIDAQSSIISIDRLKNSQRLCEIRDFKKVLGSNGVKIIAEVKKRSPSEDDIMINADPSQVAASYQANGAVAISVLTDRKFFGGNIEFIKAIKDVVNLPVLRKDFIISEYQVWESFQSGADAILLIADAIEYNILIKLYQLSLELGMHVLVEAHSLESIEKIVKLNPFIVGINCRDLKSMQTDITWFNKVYGQLPKKSIKIAESGMKSNKDIKYIETIGYNAALIGTALMKTGYPGNALAQLLNRVPA